MARRIIVVGNHSNEPTGELLKKSVAELSVRRLLADWVVKGVSIRRRKIRQINLAAMPKEFKALARSRRDGYRHHIEPKIVPTTFENSEYMRYLEGWDWSTEQISA